MNWSSWYCNGNGTVTVTGVTSVSVTSVSVTSVSVTSVSVMVKILSINMVVSNSETGS